MKQGSSPPKSQKRRFGLYNLLGLVCTFLIVASFLSPWWEITFHGMYRPWTIVVYPYGAYGELPVVGNPTNPTWFLYFTIGFLACITLSLLGSFLKGIKAKVLLGAAGAILLYIVYRFYFRMLQRTSSEGVPLEGTTLIEMAQFKVSTGFQLGFNIAILAGALCIALAVLMSAYVRLRRKSLKTSTT